MKGISIKLPEIKFGDFPKPVQISLAVIGASFALFLVLLLTLSQARETAESDVTRLRSELKNIDSNLKQSQTDYDFIVANKDRYDALVASDKLIPHTRRTAIREMQALAEKFGLSTLNYNFQAAPPLSPEAASQQPKNDLYKVYVENLELTLGAPVDGSIYKFIAATHDKFPGAMVVTEIEMERLMKVGAEELNKVSRGEESGIVKGKVVYSWRTAQQNEQKTK